MVSGESHYYRGRRYRLQVVETDGPPRVELRGHQSLVLHARPGATAEDRERLLQRWYRDRLRELTSAARAVAGQAGREVARGASSA
jgi:predicted metal-dependent hydrolase